MARNLFLFVSLFAVLTWLPALGAGGAQPAGASAHSVPASDALLPDSTPPDTV